MAFSVKFEDFSFKVGDEGRIRERTPRLASISILTTLRVNARPDTNAGAQKAWGCRDQTLTPVRLNISQNLSLTPLTRPRTPYRNRYCHIIEDRPAFGSKCC